MNGKQLKNSILQWAIQGKLVPQDPNDEPASVLLERIRAEKARLVKEKKIKKDKNESIIYRGDDNSYYEKILATEVEKCIDEEIPFEVPNGWEWCRLNDLALYRKGPFGSSLTKSMFVAKSNQSVKVYEQKNAIQKNFRLGDYYISKEKFEAMQSFIVKPNDIIVSCAGTIGETYLLPLDAPVGIINQALMRVTLFDLSMAEYWQMYFAYMLLNEAQMKGAGSAIKNIPPFEYLKTVLVPVPPLSEQTRLVERYNLLLSLIAKYESEADKLNCLNLNIYDKLKKSVLQEAIQGKLVPQIAEEGTAQELLEQIKAEKEKLVKEGKLKKAALNDTIIFRGDDNKYWEKNSKIEKDITDEIPFEIPDSWVWCRLSNLVLLLSGRDLELTQYNSVSNGIPYMTGASNFKNGILIKNRWTDTPIVISVLGDLLITCKGTIGEMAFNTIGDIHIARQIMAIRSSFVDLNYIQYYLSANLQVLQRQANSMIPGISRGTLLNAIVPLPPLMEQARIVAIIKHLASIMRG